MSKCPPWKYRWTFWHFMFTQDVKMFNFNFFVGLFDYMCDKKSTKKIQVDILSHVCQKIHHENIGGHFDTRVIKSPPTFYRWTFWHLVQKLKIKSWCFWHLVEWDILAVGVFALHHICEVLLLMFSMQCVVIEF